MEDLYNQIKKLRNSFAFQENMPAYCVFENKTIDEIVKNLPTTLDELADVKGFKQKRIEKYGQAIVELVSSYLKENNIVKEEINFSSPTNLLNILTSKKACYEDILDLSKKLLKDIVEEHVIQNSNSSIKPQAITQCILECYKIINNFKSSNWVLKNDFSGGIKENETCIEFKRLNSEGAYCHYQMFNFSQIETEYCALEPKESIKTTKAEENDTIKDIIKLVKKGENLFITGHAGTGKSYILNKLKEKFKKMTITSTTGIAAVNVKGQTIHSFCGIGACKKPIELIIEELSTKKVSIRNKIKKCKILAVDEVSMLNIKTLEYADAVFKAVKESTEPFGGVQVIFIGDFFQLPPVEKDEIERKYCFESDIWQKLNLKNIILNKSYRQQEKEFIEALSHMRTNSLNESDIALFNSRNVENKEDSNMLHIFSTNEEADAYNKAKFDSIDSPIEDFLSDDGVLRGDDYIYNNFSETENKILEIFNKNCRFDKELRFKLGAKVMLLSNLDFATGLINGSIGTIKAFLDNAITVLFDNGVEKDIKREAFEYFYNDKPIAQRRQYPLKLAYAITIHKSQGMTLDKLFIDCKRIFEKGQAYVAMSRVKTLDGLYLANFTPDRVSADSKVVEFYNSL